MGQYKTLRGKQNKNKNIGVSFHDLALSNGFLDITAQHKQQKQK